MSTIDQLWSVNSCSLNTKFEYAEYIHRLKSVLKLTNFNTVIKLQINNLFTRVERIFYDIEILNIKDRTINVHLFCHIRNKDRKMNYETRISENAV